MALSDNIARGKCPYACSPDGSETKGWHTCCAPVIKGKEKEHKHRCPHGPFPKGYVLAKRGKPGQNRYEIVGRVE